MSRNPELQERYDEALLDMELSGVVEEVPEGEISSELPTFYLPHRPVVREDKVSTKVRPVFDASAKGANGLSLTDCMEKGPNLIPNLVQILIRFRKWPVALIADIQKAFLQIVINRADQDVHKFLWLKDNALRIMRIVRVPFGNRSSPFLLNATVRYHLSKFEQTRTVSELKENLYVDDWLTGADDVSEAKSMVEEAHEVLNAAHMKLTKWGCNEDSVLQDTMYSISDKSGELSGNSVKILGLQWDQVSDCFSYEGLDLSVDLLITKRIVLSLIARLFDPLGFLTPFIITLKCLFQELWRLGLDWDAAIPNCFREIVESWLTDLMLIKTWRIPRPLSAGKWRSIVAIKLHGFGDASEKAYGACVYVVARLEDGTMTSMLAVSKAKVAPLKRVTLPRLELLGAVLAAQLVDFVRVSLTLSIDQCFGWSDSTVVLNWIKGDSAKWKPFVANRIAEIQRLTNPSQWAHCKGSENPADLVTRGISANDLIYSKLWLQGPALLCSEAGSSEQNADDCMDSVADERSGSTRCDVTLSAVQQEGDLLLTFERFGSFQKCISVMAWMGRFVQNSLVEKKGRVVGELSFQELENAKITLLRLSQSLAFGSEIQILKENLSVPRKSSLYKLSPFLDDKGLLRVKTRLELSQLSYDEKCPVIVPKGHLAELIVRYQHQLLKHAGVSMLMSSVRNSYWVIGLRRIAKRVKRTCFACQRLDSKASSQPFAPLPEVRVQPNAPFSVVGIDHAGPLYCDDSPGKKFLYSFNHLCSSPSITS